MDGKDVEPAFHLALFQVAHWNSVLEPQGRSKVLGFPVVLYYSVGHGHVVKSGLLFLLSCSPSNLEDKHPFLRLGKNA